MGRRSRAGEVLARWARPGAATTAGRGAEVEGKTPGRARLAGRAGAGPVHARYGVSRASRRGHEQGHRPVDHCLCTGGARSKSRARRRARTRWSKRRSPIHRLGSTTKPRMSSPRSTIAGTRASVTRQTSTRAGVAAVGPGERQQVVGGGAVADMRAGHHHAEPQAEGVDDDVRVDPTRGRCR